MEFKVRYNKVQIMYEAHKFYRDGRMGDFAECLRKAWQNAKATKAFLEGVGEVANTWKGWENLGREVIHNEKTIGQVEVWVTHLKNKIRSVRSYFTYGQTCEAGTQPPKA